MTQQHATLAPSSATRWMACPGSIALSKGLPESPTSPYAAEGILAHQLAEKAGRAGVDPNEVGSTCDIDGHEITVDEDMVHHVNEYLAYCHRLALDEQKGKAKKPGPSWTEQRVRLDYYGLPSVWGTADRIIVGQKTDTLHVIDLKYGKGVSVDAYENTQLKIYGAGALALLLEQDEPTPANVELHIFQPRTRPAAKSFPLPTVDLLLWVYDELAPAVKRVNDGDTSLVTGEHCRWCPAKAQCPALAKLAQETARMEFGQLPPDAGDLSDADLAKALNAAEVIAAWIGAVRAEASARADRGAKIPGWKLVARRATRKWIDENAVVDILRDRGWSDENIFAPAKIKSVAQTEAQAKRISFELPDAVLDQIDKSSSGSTLVPEIDPRDTFKPRGAADDFTAVDTNMEDDTDSHDDLPF